MAKKKKPNLEELRKKAKEFLKEIKSYPHKDISEYTRLVDSLESFIDYGVWEEEDE